MDMIRSSFSRSLLTTCLSASLLMTGCGAMEKMGFSDKKHTTAELTGKKEVPSVESKAHGKSTISVAKDRSVSGTVIVEDMVPTAAHIHQGAPHSNGPVIIPLTKSSEKMFSVPSHAKLTEEQYAAFKDGNLYVNVHSAKYPNGEIRAQMKP
jgi:hypothetical protein